MPKKYIDAEKIHDAMFRVIGKNILVRSDEAETELYRAWDELKAIPAEDVVDVVRCKNCKRCSFDEEYGNWRCDNKKVTPDFFCAHGERKEPPNEKSQKRNYG